jgi:hypothetical protein
MESLRLCQGAGRSRADCLDVLSVVHGFEFGRGRRHGRGDFNAGDRVVAQRLHDPGGLADGVKVVPGAHIGVAVEDLHRERRRAAAKDIGLVSGSSRAVGRGIRS